MKTNYKYEFYLNDNWVQVTYKSYLSYMENNDNKVRKTPIEPPQEQEIEYRYEFQSYDWSWHLISKDIYDAYLEINPNSSIVRKVPIGTITDVPTPDQPNPDYEGALKHVMSDLVNAKIIGRNILVGDLIAELSQYFNIDLKIKIE